MTASPSVSRISLGSSLPFLGLGGLWAIASAWTLFVTFQGEPVRAFRSDTGLALTALFWTVIAGFLWRHRDSLEIRRWGATAHIWIDRGIETPVWTVPAALGLLCAYQVGLAALFIADTPWTSGDSAGYLYLYPWRTLGYPFFLRALALVFDAPQSLAVVQFTLSLAAALFLAVSAGRLFRSKLLTLMFAVLLLLNWPWFFSSYLMATEQPFAFLLAFHLAFVCRALDEGRGGAWFWAAVTAALAIAVRPAGIFIVAVAPLIWLVSAGHRRRIAAWFIAPLALFLAMLVGVNAQILGIKGLSNFTGVSLAMNTMYLLKPEMETRDPVLRDKLMSAATSYQLRIDEIEDARGRFEELRRYSGPITNFTVRETAKHILSGQEAVPRTEWRSSMLPLFDDSAGLNRSYNEFARAQHEINVWRMTTDVWTPVQKALLELAIDTMVADPGHWLRFTVMKLYYGWRQVIPLFSIERNPHQIGYFDPEAPTTRYESHTAVNEGRDSLRAMADIPAAVPFVLNHLFAVPYLVFFLCVGLAYIVFRLLIQGAKASPEVLALFYAAACICVYHVELAVAQIALIRFIAPSAPFVFFIIAGALVLGLRQFNGGRSTG